MNYIWQNLGKTGTLEDFLYDENERHEIRAQFAHAPRRVLDVGCAGGAVGFGLKRDFNAYVWGVELNQVAATNAAARLDLVTQTPLELCDEAMLAQLKTIDTVLLLDVLEHMYNPWALLQFLAQHLSPDAQIIISLPNVANIGVVLDLSAGFWHYKKSGLLDITHVRFFTPYEMNKMVCETGFSIDTVDFLPHQKPESFYRLTPESEYPSWQNFGDVQLNIHSYGFWQQLHAIQVVLRVKITPDDALEDHEKMMRFEPHIPTMAF
jgi:2-polyprenyl-3-methyl-5-hydroxy-6-metoxy-1,4-benzoquinol methylase